MADILQDIDTRMYALDKALPDNSAARDLLKILHRASVEIGMLRAIVATYSPAEDSSPDCDGEK